MKAKKKQPKRIPHEYDLYRGCGIDEIPCVFNNLDGKDYECLEKSLQNIVAILVPQFKKLKEMHKFRKMGRIKDN